MTCSPSEQSQLEIFPEGEDINSVPDEKAAEGERQLETGLSTKELIANRERESKHKRDESVRHDVNLLIRLITWIAFAVVTSMFLIWIWHLCAPLRFCWLEPERQTSLQTIVLGIGVAIFSNALLPYIFQKMK